MKIQIENLQAQMNGWNLNAYQRKLALNEYHRLLDYVKELEDGYENQYTAGFRNGVTEGTKQTLGKTWR